MISGAREGTLTGLYRLVAHVLSRELTAYLVPGPEVARAYDLDIAATGIRPVASPRHARVLIVTGAIPAALCEAAAVVYAQMVRPRALLALGTNRLAPLPAADVHAELSQQGLLEGIAGLRRTFAKHAFQPEVADFDAPLLHVRTVYTCPMHPEVVQEEPGNCPKCGMFLVPREIQAGLETAHEMHHETSHTASPAEDIRRDSPPQQEAHEYAHHESARYTCPMHPEVVRNEPGNCPQCGMTLIPQNSDSAPAEVHHHPADTETPTRYTCPMHPEVVRNEPGNCPQCGMTLVPQEDDGKRSGSPQDEMGHGHGDHHQIDHDHGDHGAEGFMSMIEVTKDLPRSCDGLPMDWVDVPFGPLFPGLPGGLLLGLTLDGDTVAGSQIRSLTGLGDLPPGPDMPATQLVEYLDKQHPLATTAYRLLACRALEHAAGVTIPEVVARARIGALEKERITCHLNWLALFAEQTGFEWLHRRAADLYHQCRHANVTQLLAKRPALMALQRRLHRTPLLGSRLRGIGKLPTTGHLAGPVARASGRGEDARLRDENCVALGFILLTADEGDALARLHLRLAEILHSLVLVEAAGNIEPVSLAHIGPASGSGEAVVETSRGEARLQVTLENGQLTSMHLETPSMRHTELVAAMIDQQALGDALVAVSSLDLSPWEIPR